jgi:hypothetical protein
MKRALVIALVVAAVAAAGVDAYVKLGARAGGRLVALEWNRTIRYAVTDRSAPGVSAGELQAAVDRAFRTWAGVENVLLNIEFVGFISAEPLVDDGISVIGFRSRPDFERTLGAATHEVDDATGQLLASDVFFNTEFDWSATANGQTGRFDVESIALHEIGHFLGLGHSMLGETELRSGGRSVLGKRAVMFPIAFAPGNIEDRTLEADDIAGITDVYGTSTANRINGAVNGRVTLDGRGIFGAHVAAFNPATGALVGGYSLNDDGDFVISGLAPGLYVIRAEPLDDADLDSLFGDDAGVELDFRVTYHPQLVAVPAGGTSGEIEIKVRAK